MLALARLSQAELRALDDGPVDELLARACAVGAALIAATYPRAMVDLNREPWELDPEALRDPGAVPELRLTIKARAGLGVVPTRLLGETIYRDRLSSAELKRRLALVYQPYHAQLAAMLRERQRRFGGSLVLDCHSMPTMPPLARAERPVDVALGDRFGRSCHPVLVDTAERRLSAAGLKVARNRPYAGGHITERYGAPELSCHALQLELRRGLFMHETTHEPHAGFAALQEVLAGLVHALIEAVQQLLPASAARPPIPTGHAAAAAAAAGKALALRIA